MPMHGGDMKAIREAITGQPEPREQENAPEQSEAGQKASEEPAEEPAPIPQAEPQEALPAETQREPREVFHAALDETMEAVRLAHAALRTLKTTARDFERHVRDQIKAGRASARTKRVPFRPAQNEGLRKAS